MMPGRRQQQQPIDDSLCRRCQILEPSITVRAEPLCAGCFSKYVQTKVVKRMERFRARDADPTHERTFLLALSLGACSVALLHALSEHRASQLGKSGRTGYKLCILHITDEQQSGVSRWEEIQLRYPDHDFISIPLSASAAIEDIAHAFPGLAAEHQHGETTQHANQDEHLRRFLDTLPSLTARSDASWILMRRLIVHTAKERNCDAILWGDSTCKLAARTLAETAKGRGYSLPWIVAEGASPQGVPFRYPIGDLLNSEISAYVSFIEPSIAGCIMTDESRPAVSTKNTTIDELMRQYFESVEREYPSVVANVVRTTGKLQIASLHDIEQQCELCEMPLEGKSPEKSRLCYGCIRTFPPMT